VIQNCLAWGNVASGFYANHSSGGNTWYNNTSYKNGTQYNMLASDPNDSNTIIILMGDKVHIMRNNIGYPNKNTNMTGVDTASNSWDLMLTPADGDFLSVSDADFKGPRQADGSLPNIDFMKLSATSKMIDKGVDVDLPFAGAAPDLGCYETGLVSMGSGGMGGSAGTTGGAGTSSGAGSGGTSSGGNGASAGAGTGGSVTGGMTSTGGSSTGGATAAGTSGTSTGNGGASTTGGTGGSTGGAGTTGAGGTTSSGAGNGTNPGNGGSIGRGGSSTGSSGTPGATATAGSSDGDASEQGGCGCATAGSRDGSVSLMLAVLALARLGLRRRRSSARD